VQSDETIERLRALRDEAGSLPSSVSSAEFNSWQPRVRSVLTRALGPTHHITERFVNIKWTPSMYTIGDSQAFRSTFQNTVPRAQGILDGRYSVHQHGMADEGRPYDPPEYDQGHHCDGVRRTRRQGWNQSQCCRSGSRRSAGISGGIASVSQAGRLAGRSETGRRLPRGNQYALWMRKAGIRQLTVVINNDRVCPGAFGCAPAVRCILPRGSLMIVPSSTSGPKWELKGVAEQCS
jgi:hypothetical protein